ncbi:uncharacterized protein EI97DRAFT_17934 [Westerdykella ornata]|uniref:Uncharacterized protein n=1 Tax=Westerdykella ornata TaxID=318751 RepID=A0A6A6K0Y5_WESOR|nr:uncharacterized protein EI97DRAFT_17934 [Westerdykella ornata]KAF2280999.1 hypothetical protein EI97DRAFT_17934 [Westerdykella ornata]
MKRSKRTRVLILTLLLLCMHHLLHPSMILYPCPYPTCKNPLHLKPLIDEYPPLYIKRRHHNRLPCCEWCHAWRERDTQLARDLNNAHGPFARHPLLREIKRLYPAIHLFYQNTNTRWADMDDIRNVAYWVDEVSMLVFECWRMAPTRYPECRQLAQRLRDMAHGLQTNPHRELYFTMPMPRPSLTWE